MKPKIKDKVLTVDGYATVIKLENFRTCDRVIVKHDTTPERFATFKQGVAYFYEDLLEINDIKVKLKRYGGFEEGYTNTLLEPKSVFK